MSSIFKKLVDKKVDKVKIKNIFKTYEEYISVTCGCFGFIDSSRFLSSSLDKLVKTLVDNSHKTLKNLNDEIFDNDEILNIGNGTKIIFLKEIGIVLILSQILIKIIQPKL